MQCTSIIRDDSVFFFLLGLIHSSFFDLAFLLSTSFNNTSLYHAHKKQRLPVAKNQSNIEVRLHNRGNNRNKHSRKIYQLYITNHFIYIAEAQNSMHMLSLRLLSLE